MNKFTARLAFDLMKIECESSRTCRDCGFYAGEDKFSICIFGLGFVPATTNIWNLPNLYKEGVTIKYGKEK